MPARLVTLLRRRWQVLAVTVLSGLVVAAIAHPDWGVHDYKATHVLYSAAAARVPATGTSAQPPPLVDPFLLKPGAIASLATSGQAASAVADALGFDGDPLALSRRVTATADTAAATVSITARSRGRPADAVLLADTTGSMVVKLVDASRSAARQRAVDNLHQRSAQLEQEITALNGSDAATASRRAQLNQDLAAASAQADGLTNAAATSGVVTIRPAVAERIPSHSLQALPPMIGWLLTLLLLSGVGVALTLAVERADDRITDHESAEQVTGLPLLTLVPGPGNDERIATAHRRLYDALARPNGSADASSASGSFVVPKVVSGQGRVVLISSPTADDVTTQTVINLAQAVAAAGRTALIIDCDDDEQGRVSSRDNGDRGLGDIARDGIVLQSLSSLAQATSMPRVSLVSRGSPDAPAAEFLANHHHLVRSARDLADVVIVHGPGILDGDSALALAKVVDDTVLVCNADSTRRADARNASTALYQAGAHAGLVVVGGALPAAEQRVDPAAIVAKIRDDPKLRGRLEWAGAGVAMLVLYVLLRSFVFESFNIPTRSMVPYLVPGDRVLVSRLSYRLHDVHRGDVIVFSPPKAARSLTTSKLIKRVIGLPGDTVESSSGHVLVNGKALAEPYLPRGVVTDGVKRETVPQGSYWVMGDNRGDSADSRYFGTVTRGAIIGRAFFHLWPWPIGLM